MLRMISLELSQYYNPVQWLIKGIHMSSDNDFPNNDDEYTEDTQDYKKLPYSEAKT